MMNINIIPNNTFNLGKFEVRIKMSYDKLTTKFKGDVRVARYLLYTQYKGGWRICQATWDRKAYDLPRLDFFYINECGICSPAPGKVDENTKRVVATLCDTYDKQMFLSRSNGHRKVSSEEAFNAPFEEIASPKDTTPDDFQDAVATV